MDAYAKLFCIYMNNAPEMATYFIDKTVLTNQEVDLLTSNPNKKGFINTIIGSDFSSTSTLSYYPVGSVMKKKLNGVIQNFTLPLPDLNGICDNFKLPKFMESESSECIQTIDIQTQCGSLANSSTYISDVHLLSD